MLNKTIIIDGAQYAIHTFKQTGSEILDICYPLAIEDDVVQTVPAVGPPQWHIAHTSWFFHLFVQATLIFIIHMFADNSQGSA